MSNYNVSNGLDLNRSVNFSSPNVKLANDRNLSPNRYSPSESLSRTTKARIYDSNELEKRKIINTEVIEPKKINRNAVISPPSDNLMKSTQSRLYDKDTLLSSKGLIKHEDDPFWEQRKPVDLANNKKFQVDSKLYEPTTATIFYQRKKHPAAIPHNKSIISTTVISESVQNTHVPSIKPINPESPLLKKTFNSIIKDVKVPLPSPPPKPTLHLATQFSSLAPPEVPSKLYENTFCIENSKWKNKQDVEKENHVIALKHTQKIKPPSDHLLLYTKAMQNAVRSKVTTTEKDSREIGWSNSYKDLSIPDMEHVVPIRSSTTTATSIIPNSHKRGISEHKVNVNNVDINNLIDGINTYNEHEEEDEEDEEILEMQEMLKEMSSDQFNNNESETY